MGGIEDLPQTREVTPEQMAAWRERFAEAIAIVEEEDVPYLVGGSVACNAWGRPSSIGDIDLIIRPTDAKRLLGAFASSGYETDEIKPTWLYKATKEGGPTIDLLFEMEGSVYLDEDMLAHGVYTDIEGTKARLIGPEDYVVTQALATKEDTPNYWHNALSVIAKTDLDYDYVIERAAMGGSRRMLSLLAFAESSDVIVPAGAIKRLFEVVYGP